MHIGDILKYYSGRDVRDSILRCAQDREIAPRYRNGGFGKRPQMLRFPRDLESWVREGAVSFHMSEERWINPMMLSSEMSKKEIDGIRKGWDLVFDIDTDFFEYGRWCAYYILKALEYHEISDASIKFSGNKGWHIALPFETFPEELNGELVSKLFPESAMRIAMYISKMIAPKLSEKIMEIEGGISSIIRKTGKKFEELVVDDELDPFSLVSLDTVAISSRHLIRMPYVFNEKSWLVSVPLGKRDVLSFSKDDAKPGNFDFSKGFLERKGRQGQAKQLFVQAYDFFDKMDFEKEVSKNISYSYELPKKAITDENLFAPCIKNILKGVEDGRKRSVMILITYLHLLGWDFDSIRKRLLEWNSKNPSPLVEGYILSQISWHEKNPNYMPPNCDNVSYYKDFGVWTPECANFKNPLTYTFKRLKSKGGNRK